MDRHAPERRCGPRPAFHQEVVCVVRDERDGNVLAMLADISDRGIGVCLPFHPSLGSLLPVEIRHSRSYLPLLRVPWLLYGRMVTKTLWQGGGQFLRPWTCDELRSVLAKELPDGDEA